MWAATWVAIGFFLLLRDKSDPGECGLGALFVEGHMEQAWLLLVAEWRTWCWRVPSSFWCTLLQGGKRSSRWNSCVIWVLLPYVRAAWSARQFRLGVPSLSQVSEFSRVFWEPSMANNCWSSRAHVAQSILMWRQQQQYNLERLRFNRRKSLHPTLGS